MPSKQRIVSRFDSAKYIFHTKALPKDRTNSFIEKNGKMRRINTNKTRYFERTVIRNETSLQHLYRRPFEGDLAMQLNIRFPDFRHGDIDNLEKSICDGMQSIAFKNDNQIKSMHCDLFFGGPYLIETILQPWRPKRWEERSSAVYFADTSPGACGCVCGGCCAHPRVDF